MNHSDTTLEIADLARRRPRLVTIAAALLLFNVVVLFVGWIAAPAAIQSNGAQVFFMIMWFAVAISVYRGMSWVRYAIVAALVVFVCEILNAKEPLSMVRQMGLGDQLSKSIGLVAVVLLFLPQSHNWYREVKEYSRAPTKKATKSAA